MDVEFPDSLVSLASAGSACADNVAFEERKNMTQSNMGLSHLNFVKLPFAKGCSPCDVPFDVQ